MKNMARNFSAWTLFQECLQIHMHGMTKQIFIYGLNYDPSCLVMAIFRDYRLHYFQGLSIVSSITPSMFSAYECCIWVI